MINNSFKKIVEDIHQKLQKNLSKKRYEHILSVYNLIKKFGKIYCLDLEKLTLSALLHDFAKYLSLSELVYYCSLHKMNIDDYEKNSHSLLHSKGSYIFAKELYFIKDLDILNSILYHTTGRINMSIYEKLLFVSDYCEPNRKLIFSEEIINLAFHNVDEAVLKVVTYKLQDIIKKNVLIHPKSIELYNFCCQKKKSNIYIFI